MLGIRLVRAPESESIPEAIRLFCSGSAASGTICPCWPPLSGVQAGCPLAPEFDRARERRFLCAVDAELAAHLLVDAIKASIIMSAFNHAATIGRAIESVIYQDHRNWVLRSIDDGSTEPRAGMSPARNAGLARVSGDMAYYLDSGRWTPRHLQRLLAYV